MNSGPPELAQAPSFMETMRGREYQFIAEVTEQAPVASAVKVQYGNANNVEQLAPDGAKALLAPQLSIVVLPFANLGGDPEQDYFVDGVTEGLTTDLSRIPGSFVIARNSAFSYICSRLMKMAEAPTLREFQRGLG